MRPSEAKRAIARPAQRGPEATGQSIGELRPTDAKDGGQARWCIARVRKIILAVRDEIPDAKIKGPSD